MKVIFGLMLLVCAKGESPEVRVLQGSSNFATNLYAALAEREGNLVFSPFGVHALLSMAYQGAGGSTAEVLAKSLETPEARANAEGYKEIMTRLQNIENVTLLMANKVYLREDVRLAKSFKSVVTKSFLSDIQLVDFAQSEAAAKTINDWVEEKTKIEDLVDKDDLSSDLAMVLVDAVYFRGGWARKFDKNSTKTKPFHLKNNDTVDVEMMHQLEHLPYCYNEDLEAAILELPYQNQDLRMVIILPDEKDGLEAVEAKLANASLKKLTSSLWGAEVALDLPKFKLEQTVDLKEALTKLGVGEIFDRKKADFQNVIENEDQLFVGKILQKAVIEVDEEGTEAAVSTSGLAYYHSGAPLDVEFIVDHPFIFFLTTKSKNDVLFFGKIEHP